MCSFALQPGLLRRTLSGTLSSRLDNVRFQTLSGLSLRGFRVLPRLELSSPAVAGFLLHPIRIVQALLGAQRSRTIFLVSIKELAISQ